MAYVFLDKGAAPNNHLGTPARTGAERLNARFNTAALSIAAGLIATDASLGGTFDVTVGSDCTLSNPTNGVDGQIVMWRIKYQGSGNVVSYGNKFRVPEALVDDQEVPEIGGTLVQMTAKYNATDDLWDVQDVVVNAP